MSQQTSSARQDSRRRPPLRVGGALPVEVLREVELRLRHPRLSARTRCHLRMQRAKANWRLGHTEQALTEMQHLRQELSPERQEPRLAVLLIDLAGVQINMAGCFEAALDTLAQAQAMADASQDPTLQARVLCATGPLLGRLGHLEDAEQVLRKGLRLLPAHRPTSLSLSLKLNLGRVLIGLERWAEAIGLLDAALVTLGTVRPSSRGGLSIDQLRGRQRSALRLLALACARGGNVAKALALCEQAQEKFAMAEHLEDGLGTSLVRAEALWRAGQRQLARQQFEQLMQQAKDHGLQAMVLEIQEVMTLLRSRQDPPKAPSPVAKASAWPGPAELRENLLRRDLRLALGRQELQAWFQPIMNADGHSSQQLELLARWPHRHWGWVPPQQFIALAEQGPCIHELGRWTLATAAALLAHHAKDARLIIGVNLSVAQLTNAALVEDFMGILLAHHIAPQRIVLELTESQPLSEDPATLQRLISLRTAGFGLALDDFGAGFANFDLLDRGLFDQLKIDRSLIATPEHLGRRRAILEAIQGLAARLQLRVVAEGVERREQWQLLRDCGIDHFQGFLFAHPMPPSALQPWLREHGGPS